MPSAHKLGDTSGSPTPESYWATRARALTGLLPQSSAWYFDHFVGALTGGAYSSAAVGGNQANLIAAGGVVQLNSTAAANTTGDVSMASALTNFIHMIPGGSTKKFYAGIRLRPSVVDAEAKYGFLSREQTGGTSEVLLGFNGATHASQWSLTCGTGSLVSGVAASTTAFTVVEAWRDGSTTYLAVNEAVVASGANVHPNNIGQIRMISQNGAAGGVRSLRVDWLAIMCEQDA